MHIQMPYLKPTYILGNTTLGEHLVSKILAKVQGTEM